MDFVDGLDIPATFATASHMQLEATGQRSGLFDRPLRYPLTNTRHNGSTTRYTSVSPIAIPGCRLKLYLPPHSDCTV